MTKPQAAAEQKTVALLEDDSSIREMITSILAAGGYAVSSAPSGMELVELIAGKAPDAFIIDLSLPLTDGDKVMKTFQHRGLAGSAPVIIVSSREPAELERAASWVKAAACLRKPFVPQELLQAVDQATGTERTSPAKKARKPRTSAKTRR